MWNSCLLWDYIYGTPCIISNTNKNAYNLDIHTLAAEVVHRPADYGLLLLFHLSALRIWSPAVLRAGRSWKVSLQFCNLWLMFLGSFFLLQNIYLYKPFFHCGVIDGKVADVKADLSGRFQRVDLPPGGPPWPRSRGCRCRGASQGSCFGN